MFHDLSSSVIENKSLKTFFYFKLCIKMTQRLKNDFKPARFTLEPWIGEQKNSLRNVQYCTAGTLKLGYWEVHYMYIYNLRLTCFKKQNNLEISIGNILFQNARILSCRSLWLLGAHYLIEQRAQQCLLQAGINNKKTMLLNIKWCLKPLRLRLSTCAINKNNFLLHCKGALSENKETDWQQ